MVLGLLPVCGADPSAHVALGLQPVFWQTMRTCGAWAALGVSHARVHLGTHGTWVMALDPRGRGPASGPKINGSCVTIQFYWILHQDPRFLGPTILNIIMCFRNIIIFIIINIINKIINKFERKYYY